MMNKLLFSQRDTRTLVILHAFILGYALATEEAEVWDLSA